MRKTKIICTIGPSSESEEILTKMCNAGMNVARLNFSHGTYEEHLAKIKLIKKVREKLNIPLPIMLDTKGPEYRIKTFKNGKEILKEGNLFTLTTKDIEGTNEIVSVSYKNLIQDLKVKDKILVCNGLIVLEVKKLTETDAICEILIGGEISDRKSMHFPNKVMKGVFLSEQDKSDILFGIQNGIDFVAASFVSIAQDVKDIRKFLDENGGSDIEIIAKIENRSGVNNIDEICEVADGIMVARGDLGVEIPSYEVPSVQKYLINKCRLLGKCVITATEMLETMIYNTRPTRAEVSDVANAVYDGTSAIMLSGESAMGKYPVETVQKMSEIAEFTESQIDYKKRFYDTEFEIKSVSDAVSHSACSMAINVNAKCICASSLSGKTVRLVSRFRCPITILGITTNQRAWQKLSLSWGVIPLFCESENNIDIMLKGFVNKAKVKLNLQDGDSVVLTGDSVAGKSGTTNMIKVETISNFKIL